MSVVRRRLVVWGCSLSLGASLLMAGCDRYNMLCGEEGPIPQGLVAQDVIGSYEGKPFGVLTVRADGTFTADDWADYDMLASKFENVGAVQGRWELRVRERTAAGFDDEAFSLTILPERRGSNFYVTGSRKSPRLYQYGDADSCLRFHQFMKRQ
ncbi:hypothetical protein [Streptomyces ehimensis]|uniref:Lipoprotein n=1 Tax=Streptomyces ehimensis TaxID=68195 RepID=A0ABV9BT25_9ACTN